MAKQRLITWKICFKAKQLDADYEDDANTSFDENYDDNLSKPSTYNSIGNTYKDTYAKYSW